MVTVELLIHFIAAYSMHCHYVQIVVVLSKTAYLMCFNKQLLKNFVFTVNNIRYGLQQHSTAQHGIHFINSRIVFCPMDDESSSTLTVFQRCASEIRYQCHLIIPGITVVTLMLKSSSQKGTILCALLLISSQKLIHCRMRSKP